MPSLVTHLESPVDGARLPHDRLQNMHAGRPLLARYDLASIKDSITRGEVSRRPRSMWQWRELLPLDQPGRAVRLGERATPLLPCPRLGAELGLASLCVKDESTLPTGSFKSRGMAVAVSRARELGAKRLAIPTAGNAGGALAAYAARAGMEAWVFMPDDTPIVNQVEATLLGARVFLVDGLITDCGALVREFVAALGGFDLSTLKEPYRLEGKKTMGLELAQDCGWKLPDVILYPTGGGTGLIGMWKAFDELEQLGWIEPGKRPRFYACQSDGCAPIVRAFERGDAFAEPFENARTAASGLRVPAAVGDFLILQAVRASGGAARSAREEEIVPWARRASAREGLSICPETGACFAVLADLVRAGEVRRDERVVVFNTGAAQKYVEALRVEPPRLARGKVDWDAVAAAPRRGPALTA